MPEKRIVDEYSAIREGLERVEEEKKRKFNPPVVYEMSQNAGDFAWEIVQRGRLQQSYFWHTGDELATKASFVLTDTTVQPFMIWLDQQPIRDINTLARRPFSCDAGYSERISNLKRIFCRLRIMKVI